MPSGHGSLAGAVGVLLFWGSTFASADPPAAGGGASATGPAPVQGGFFSSLKQALSQDVDREVVWGHFDVGSPPDTHRFYCLLDPKTGKREPNGVAGELFIRRDGTTGLKRPAVSPVSCAEAEKKGILDTAGYVLKSGAASATTLPVHEKGAVPPPASTSGGAAPSTAMAPPESVTPVVAASPVSAAPPVSAASPVSAAASVPAGVAAIPAVAGAAGADHSADRAYIQRAESDWGASVVTQDVSVLERILSDDFIGVDVDGTHYSKADAINEYRSKASNYTSNHMNGVEIRFYGQAAVAQGDNSWQLKDGTSGRHVWTAIWVERDGKWQVVAAEDLVPPARGFRHP